MKALALVLTLLLAGCATQKELVPTGGSRADGIVRESYEFGGFEKPVVDYQQGANLAAQRCAGWGYTGAQGFGGSRSQCEFFNAYGCVRWLVTVEYQCTGGTASR
jgi:YecR-like lipoprotein